MLFLKACCKWLLCVLMFFDVTLLTHNNVFWIWIWMYCWIATHSFTAGFRLGIDHDGPQPPVSPFPRPDVQPVLSGTHLLFSQNGRIEHIPLEGYDMKPDQAKTGLHLPVSLTHYCTTYCCSDYFLLLAWEAYVMFYWMGFVYLFTFLKILFLHVLLNGWNVIYWRFSVLLISMLIAMPCLLRISG